MSIPPSTGASGATAAASAQAAVAKQTMENIHAANKASWDAVSPGWQEKIDAEGRWRQCPEQPHLVLSRQEMDWLGDISGKSVCVLGSGDNLVAFALAGMGADVTSVDISPVQLEIADRRAAELRLEVTFVCADVTDLREIPDESFDLVYTGGHVAIWVSDLKRYYREAARILKPGGTFLVNEYHPVRRIWKQAPEGLVMEGSYFDRGPHRFDRSEDVPDAVPGAFPSYEFNWTAADYVQAILAAGCELVWLDEFGDAQESWEGANLKGLPQSLLLVGRRREFPSGAGMRAPASSG